MAPRKPGLYVIRSKMKRRILYGNIISRGKRN